MKASSPRPPGWTPEQVEAKVREIDPKFKREGDELLLLNPNRKDRGRKSFKINRKTCLWSDFATGEKGRSVESFLTYCKGFRNTKHSPVPPTDLSTLTTWPTAPKDDAGPDFTQPRLKVPGCIFTATWCYRDVKGHPVMYVARFDHPDQDKQIRPYRFAGGCWEMGDPSGPLPLYRLDQLAARPDARVLVCEGEKAADAAQNRFKDHVCITSPHGANSAAKADWSPLNGRLVTIWPDNDEPGRSYAQDAAHLIFTAGATKVSLVQIPGNFPEKWDLADKPPKDADLIDLLDGAHEVKRPASPIEMVDPSKWATIDPPQVRWLVKGLLPQGVPSILAGKSNGGKSLVALQLSMSIAAGLPLFGFEHDGVARKVIYVSMEDDRDELHRRFRRFLDLLRGWQFWTENEESGLLSNWRAACPNWASAEKKSLVAITSHLQRFAAELCSSKEQLGLIVLDTLAALSEGDENAADVQASFWAACHQLAEGTGASPLVIHHVRKQAAPNKLSMIERLSFDNLRGSSAIVAGARAILQLEPLSPEEAVKHGLDEDRAVAGNYVVLALTKLNSGVKGGWVALKQRSYEEVGAGFFDLHEDSEHLCAALRSKNAAAKLGQADQILLDLDSGVPLEDIARKIWPNDKDSNKKLTKTLSDIRRRQKWLEPGSVEFTQKGRFHILKLREKGMRRADKSADINGQEPSKIGHQSNVGRPTKPPNKAVRRRVGEPPATPPETGKEKSRHAESGRKRHGRKA